MPDDLKTVLCRYLDRSREALVWKLDGLSEYDVRRPLVPSGTNLLGLVKHVASVEAGYLGESFGRPFSEPMPWFDDGADVNADMWATPDESREAILGLYQRVAAHSQQTLDALTLDSQGAVAWWPAERNPVTLGQILVHLVTEANRHCGHADILRELIDGSVGIRPDLSNMAFEDVDSQVAFYDRVEQGARAVGQ